MIKSFGLCLLLLSCLWLNAADTIQVNRNQILILEDTIYAPDSDTVFFVRDSETYKVRTNPYKSSADFYEKMKERTGQNKVTAQLFDLLYVNNRSRTEGKSKNSRTSNEPFKAYEGLVIRSVRIKFVDILEGSVTDTLRSASSGVAKVANRLHINTWNQVIRNNLLLRVNEPIDPYSMADNERILRRLRFVEDAKIYVSPSGENEADLIIVIKDRLSWGVAVNVDGYNDFRTELFNRNIAGWGKYASATWLYNGTNESPSGYNILVGGQNIDKTITNWQLDHGNNLNNKTWGLSLQKEFVAPEVKYGGGLDVRWEKDTTLILDRTRSNNAPFSLNYQDAWIGRSFQLASVNSRKNLILSSRLLSHSFSRQPFVSSDSNFLFYNRKILLTEISLSKRKFMKTNYISSFGISEDIPLGYRFSFITGWDFNQFYTQRYYGYQIFWSFYVNNFGFLLLNQEIGAFDRNGLNNGSIKMRINYFSPLIHIGRYYFRNFVRINQTRGIGQPLQRSISLRGRIRDIEGINISGNNIFSVAVETVMFTPWYLYGFRFAPFVYFNAGETWDTRYEQTTRFGYQGLGFGFRIRNESLVFNTLEMRITHFLKAPEQSENTLFSLSATIPISFENVFKFKPLISSFD